MYDPTEISLPPNHAMELNTKSSTLDRRFREGSPQSYASYYGMISHLDFHIGRILEALKSANKVDDTIIVFASDHGLSMQSHGQTGKHNAHEHSSRALLSISGPGLPKNKRSSALTYLFDIYPTLCRLAGLKTPEALEGRSLAGIIHGEQKHVRNYLMTAYMSNQRSIRDNRWKLFYDLNSKSVQLYDLVNDPYELKDLSNQKDKNLIVENLKLELAKARSFFRDDPSRSNSNFGPRRGGFFRRR